MFFQNRLASLLYIFSLLETRAQKQIVWNTNRTKKKAITENFRYRQRRTIPKRYSMEIFIQVATHQEALGINVIFKIEFKQVRLTAKQTKNKTKLAILLPGGNVKRSFSSTREISVHSCIVHKCTCSRLQMVILNRRRRMKTESAQIRTRSLQKQLEVSKLVNINFC